MQTNGFSIKPLKVELLAKQPRFHTSIPGVPWVSRIPGWDPRNMEFSPSVPIIFVPGHLEKQQEKDKRGSTSGGGNVPDTSRGPGGVASAV